jgi:protein phosphatase
MGTHNKVEVDVFKVNVLFENNDRLLLCSDGLYDYFSQDELAAFFTIPLLNDAAQQMVDAAKQRGGHDNITVLLVEKVGNDEFQASRPTENVDVE